MEWGLGGEWGNLKMYDLAILLESLDTDPYELIPLTVSKEFQRQQGISDMHLYRTKDDPDHYFGHFVKDGFVEPHHEYHGTSGVVVHNLPSDHKAKFIKTFSNMISGLLDSGKAVRMSAPENLIGSYHGLAKLITRRNKDGVTVSEPEYSHDGFVHENGVKSNEKVSFYKFHISKSPIKEAVDLLHSTHIRFR